VKVTRNKSRALRPVRVRLEFSAYRRPESAEARYLPDRKIISLRVLLTERFGEDGSKAYLDWLDACVEDQTIVSQVRKGGARD
jgi:hypothetical protein